MTLYPIHPRTWLRVGLIAPPLSNPQATGIAICKGSASRLSRECVRLFLSPEATVAQVPYSALLHKKALCHHFVRLRLFPISLKSFHIFTPLLQNPSSPLHHPAVQISIDITSHYKDATALSAMSYQGYGAPYGRKYHIHYSLRQIS